MSYINIHIPFFGDVVYIYSTVLHMQVHCCHNMLFISILVPCVVCVSVPITGLHEHAYTVLLLLWYEYALFTNKVWKFNLLQGLHSIAPPSFVCVSVSISELHQRAYSRCSLLWCKKVLFTNQLSEYIGVISLNPTCLSSFMHPSIQARELHEHTCPTSMYEPKLFIVVFQKVRCLNTL